MRARTIDRLLARSAGSGRRARWASRRLLRAGDGGDPGVTDACWDRWLRDADPDLGAALTRWHRPHSAGGLSLVALGEPAAAADVIEAARRLGHPVAELARARIRTGPPDLVDAVCAAALTDAGLAGFCVDHHLAPADPHRAAEFFLLTGQREQYRLADPDHSLLAVTYRGAPEDQRARIRVLVAGEPDLVRVLAETNRRDGMTRLSEPEAGYLTGELAQRRDWAALWTLARDLPVRQAIDAVRLIEGWSPAPADEPLFHALAGADPTSIDEARAALVLPWSLSVATSGTPVDGSFAPDGARFAVVNQRGVDVHALPSGAHEPRNSRQDEGIRAVMVLDDAVIVTAGRWGESWGMAFVDRGGDGRTLTRRIVPGAVPVLRRRPGGYTALVLNNGHVWLRLQDDDGRYGPLPRPRTVSVVTDLVEPLEPEAWALSCDPAGNRIAVAGDRIRVLSESPSMVQVESSAAPPAVGSGPAVALAGPGRLLTLDGAGLLRLWRQAGGTLKVVVERRFAPIVGRPALVDVPEADVFAVLEDSATRPVRLVDRETLADVAVPPSLADRQITCLFGLPGTSLLGAGAPGRVEVVDLGSPAMAALIDRPVAATSPADLHAVFRRLDRLAPTAPARPALELLSTCLEHRFGSDVALGGDGAVIARSDDIALGGA